MKRGIAIALAVIGAFSWHVPGFNGVFFAQAAVTAGDGQIVAAVFLVGAALLWFMPER